MTVFAFDGILLKSGWIERGFVRTDRDGKIEYVGSDRPRMRASEKLERVKGFLIPGFFNSHCHVFQYAMAGLTEYVDPGHEEDDFWTWREKMYEVALQVSPEQLKSIASFAYAEMLRAGYTWVVEFQYLHHDPKGKSYRQLNLLSEILVEAADSVGMGMTLVPVFYECGGFGEPLRSTQRRFGFHSLNEYMKLLSDCRSLQRSYPELRVGVGAHSLRASTRDALLEIFALREGPKHIHIAEQIKEVDDCLNFNKKRPVEWFLEKCRVGPDTFVVHATHTTPQELEQLADKKVSVVLCPSTEGNLGDGFFQLTEFWKKGGHWTIGTDSQISINPFEELRWADYVQRLRHQKRNVFCPNGGDQSAERAVTEVVMTGARASGVAAADFFENGRPLTGLVMDSEFPLFHETHPSMRLSSLVYSGQDKNLLGTLVSGKWVVKDGTHVKDSSMRKKFNAAMKALGIRKRAVHGNA